MMRMVLLSRSAQWGVLVVVVMWALAMGIGPFTLEIDLSPMFPPTKLAIIEFCAIVSATMLAMVTRPRFWEWDRIARGHRAQVVAGAIAAAAIALSAVGVLFVVPLIPAGATWGWVLGNAFVVAAAVQLLAPLSNPLIAGALTMVAWIVCAVVTNLAPKVWVPLAHYRHEDVPWVVALVLGVLAVVVHVRTCGVSAWAHRQFDRE